MLCVVAFFALGALQHLYTVKEHWCLHIFPMGIASFVCDCVSFTSFVCLLRLLADDADSDDVCDGGNDISDADADADAVCNGGGNDISVPLLTAAARDAAHP